MKTQKRYLSPRTTKINVCITEEMHDKIMEEAIKEERTLSSICYRLMRDAMNSNGLELCPECKRRLRIKEGEKVEV